MEGDPAGAAADEARMLRPGRLPTPPGSGRSGSASIESVRRASEAAAMTSAGAMADAAATSAAAGVAAASPPLEGAADSASGAGALPPVTVTEGVAAAAGGLDVLQGAAPGCNYEEESSDEAELPLPLTPPAAVSQGRPECLPAEAIGSGRPAATSSAVMADGIALDGLAEAFDAQAPSQEPALPAEQLSPPKAPGRCEGGALPGVILSPEKGTRGVPIDTNTAAVLSSTLSTSSTSRGGDVDPSVSGARQPGILGSHQWPEAELPAVCARAGQVLRVFCGVWNLHGKQAPADLSAWVMTRPRHHIYVIGTCECERSLEKSMIYASKARWEQQVRDHLGKDYVMVGSHNMSAIHIMVFVHSQLGRYCWDVKTGQVATGFGNIVGNKGGTQVGFCLGHTSVLVVNAHLPAHQGKMKDRTQSFSRILMESPIRRDKVSSGVHEDYDRVFFMGDLNPRLNATRNEVDHWLAERRLEKCLECDELLPLLRASPGRASVDGSVGMWPLFEEATIEFPPTYKFDTHTGRYDTSKKQRVPSWTDRILWKRDSHVRSMAYKSVEALQCSDHRPIYAQFEMHVDLDNWEGPADHWASLRAKQREDARSTVCSVQ